MLDTSTRITRRRSSAGPIPPQRPVQPRPRFREAGPSTGSGPRPTFLTLRDHGKVYVADLPRLSDGQLAHIVKEAEEVLESLNRRLHELEGQIFLSQTEQDTRIRATTKRDVTERFLAAISQEQDLRRSNPAVRAAAGESLSRAFLELARHRLPGSTFDSLLQEALAACGPGSDNDDKGLQRDAHLLQVIQGGEGVEQRPESLPVVITPDADFEAETH